MPRVALVDRTGHTRDPAQVCDLWLADGYLSGPSDVGQLLTFVEAVVRGDRPVVAPEERRGTLARFLHRLKAR